MFIPLSLLIVLPLLFILYFIIKFIAKPYFAVKSYERKGETYTYFKPVIGFFMLVHESFAKYRDFSMKFHEIINTNPNMKYFITNMFDRPYVLLIDQDMQKDFYVENANLYEKYPIGTDNFVRVMGESMPFVEGAEWKKRRMLFSKVFNYNFLNAIFPRVLKTCEETFGKIIKEGEKEGKIEVLEETQKFSSSIIMRSFFASNFHEQQIDGESLIKVTVDLLRSISEQTMSLAYMLFGTRFLSLGIRQKDREVNRNLKKFKIATYNEVKKRIEELKS